MLSLLLPFVAVPPALAADVVTVANPGGQVGPTNVAYSKSMTATGGTAPYAWSALSLPPGLAIDAGTGLISGTPTTAGNYTTKVTATDTTGIAGTVQFSFATGVIVTYPSSRGAKTGTPITPWTLKAAGGTGTFTWTATGLPTGLAIDANTGTVSGTPTVDGTTTVMATATDTAGKSGATSFPWTVGPGATVTDPGTLHATTGVGLSKQLTATGGTTAYSWTATGLPAGLTIKSNTGVISGTPTTAGTSSAQVTVTDAAKIPTTIAVPIVVAAPVAVTTPVTRTDVTGSATSLSLAATGGVAPYTWSATGLPTGMTLDPATGVVSGTPSSAATLSVNVTATDAGQRTSTVSFTWNVSGPITVGSVYGQVGPTGVAYSKTLTASGGTAPYSWAAIGLPAGLSINANTGVISGTPTAAGNYTVKVTVTDKDGLTGAASFPFATGVIVTYPAEQGSANGTPITALVIKAAGGSGTYTWTASGLPTGLSIDAATGTVSGTPTADGAYTAVVTATDTTGTSGATSFAWAIAAAPALPNPGTVHATTGVAMSHQLTATGGKAPYSWLVTGLPAGLSKSNTGLISGTPTTAGTTTLTVTVIDALKITNTVTFPLTVGTPVTAVSPGTRNNTAGTAISNLPLTTDGGTGPYTWSVTGLPAGLAATTAGVISGTPTAAVNAAVTATVVDAAGRTATTSFTWTIAGPVTITDPGTQAGTVGTAATLTFAATGGSGGFHWTTTGLPTGLTLDTTTGIVSGTPTTEGSWTVAVTATDTNGATANRSVAWTVATAVAAITPTAQTSVAGTAVTLTLSAGGGTAPYTWTATGLPDGLSLDPSTGIVTGTPTDATAGTTVNVTVTDTAGRTDQTSFTWTVTLTAPIALTATPDGLQTVQLTWTAVDGAAAYRIYRDGTRLTDTGAITTLRDTQLDGATTYQYRIAALSGEGLETATSPATAVTTLATPAAPENYTTCFTSEPRGCTYTVSMPTDATHPDAGRELTDGIHGTVDAGPAWQGRRPNNQYTITVDLGASRPLTEINSSWLQKQSQGIALPLTVGYAFSNDGTNFTDLALITRPYVTDTDQIKTYRAAGLAETGRYVRVTVNGSSGWSLLDEIELRGVITGIQPALTLPTPAPAANDQGQQVTALPLTVTESAGPLTWTADGLPSGLSIGRTSGVITGTVRTPGTYTVTATTTSASGRTGRTSFLWKVYASPAAGPVMDSGKVTGFGPAVNSGGVAVLDGFAYTVVGSKVVKYDLTAGTLATAQAVAGGDSNGCNEGGSGGQARFYAGARVIGTDGSLIYVADPSCGLKAVTPSTGASRTIAARFNTESTIAGRYLYTLDTSKQIWRYDLQAGQTTRLFESASLYGALAADNDALWVFNNSDVKLYRLAFNGTETKTFPLPTVGISATRSAGDYIYYTDSRNLLTRISKTDGSLQIVAGDGANGDLLYSTTGIATDGTSLYTAGNQGLATLTTTPRLFTPPASSPVLDSGKVTGFGPAVNSGGVAVLDGFAYTVVGSKVVKYDLTAGTTATAQTVAGGDNNACTEGSGGQARFYAGARVIGTDGSLIYVADTSCGLKAVTPSTGASRTISARFNTESTIAGRYLYTLDNFKQIWRYDLQAGQTTRLFESASLYGALAADNDALWVFNNSDVKLYRLAFNGTETKTFPMPMASVTATRSVGDFIYYTDYRNLLTRISKTDGSLQIVAGDGANGDLLYSTSGIATDGTNLYTAGNQGLATLTTIPRRFEEPAASAPVEFGDVRPVGPAVDSGGVAVLNGFAYTIVGTKVVKYDLAAGSAAVAQTVAGGDNNACNEAGNGGQARFYAGARVIGTDGSLIYVADTSCGLKAVTPSTGASRLISARFNTESTIAGRYLYTLDTSKQIWRYDLQAGQTTRLFENNFLYGPIAADNDALWVFNNSDVKLYRLALNNADETKTYPLPAGGVTAARSAGEYVYYTDTRNLLTRISKTNGGLNIVAGDGARGALVFNTTGITTDGTEVYLAGNQGLAKLPATVRTFAPPATGPIMDSGSVSRYGPDKWALGVTILSGFAYTGMGNKVVKYDLTAGPAATPQDVVGSDTAGCPDLGNGGPARFYTPNVIANDGTLIYVADPSCGLIAINPESGFVRKIAAAVSPNSTVAGRYLYSNHNAGKIMRYDLQAGVTSPMFDDVTLNGPLAADNTFLWGFNYDARTSTSKLLALPLSSSYSRQEFTLAKNIALAAFSVGSYIYFVDDQKLLRRFSKVDGSFQIIAGDGAHKDSLLASTTSIATDDKNLYTVGEHGLHVISEALREFAPSTEDGQGPQLGVDSAEKRVASIPGTMSGVAVLGWYAYTAQGSKVFKTNVYTGETSTFAGGSSGCGDANTGDQAQFYSTSVIGFDGSLLYVYDSGCGLRAVNPATGSTRTLRTSATQRSSIAGEYLYTIDASNTLYQYGLKSGVTNKVRENLPAGALIAANESGVFIVNDRTRTTVKVEQTDGRQVERLVTSETNENLPYRVTGTQMAYADNALYVMADMSQQGSQQSTQQLARIDVIGAMTFLGQSSGVTNGINTGLAVTTTDVYRLNSNAPLLTTDLVRTHTGTFETDPIFQVDLNLYVEKGTRFIPGSNAEDKDYFPDVPALFWAPETGLCVAVCQGVKTLAKELHDRSLGGVSWPDFDCQNGLDDCKEEDFERYIVRRVVKEQRYYNSLGNLLPEVKDNLFDARCAVMAEVSEACIIAPYVLIGLVQDAETIYDIFEIVREFLRVTGGVRRVPCIPIGRNSFRGDTPVLMADGSLTAIQNIRPGQRVLAGDPASHESSAQVVIAVHATTDTELTDVTLSDGSVIHTTAHHPFWAPEKQEWTDAEDLAAGMELSSTSGITVIVKSVRNLAGSMTMYNLTVDRLHTYYVAAGGIPVLVHNVNCLLIDDLGAMTKTGETNWWDLPPKPRGTNFEEALNLSNLPDDFDTFDNFDEGTGTATSVKSIDTRKPTYNKDKGAQFYSTLMRYLKDMENYTGDRRFPDLVKPKEIKFRVYHLVVHSDELTEDQWRQLGRISTECATRKITFKVSKSIG